MADTKERLNDKKENDNKYLLQKDFDNFYALLNNHIKIIEHAEQGNYITKTCIAQAIRNFKDNKITTDNNISYSGFRVSLRSYFRSLSLITNYIKINANNDNKEVFKSLLLPHVIGTELQIIDRITLDEKFKTSIKEILKEMEGNIIIEFPEEKTGI